MSVITWTRSNGQVVPIETMNAGHLKSAIAMMKRNGFVSTSDYSLFETDPEADSEALSKMKPSTLLDGLEAELLKRGDNV